MAGNKSTVELSAKYNVAKSTISEWAKKYGEECQYKNTTQKTNESDSASKIRRLNQLLKDKDKEIYKMSRPNVQKILYKNVQLVCLF